MRRVSQSGVVSLMAFVLAIAPFGPAVAADRDERREEERNDHRPLQKIKHFVVYQENHSFDNVLGRWCALRRSGSCNGAIAGERGLTQERVGELGLELYRFRLPLLLEIEQLRHDTDDHEQAHDRPDRGDRGASAFGCRLRRRRRHDRARHSLGPCVIVYHPRCDGDQQRRLERPRSH